MSPLTKAPVLRSIGGKPETKTKPLAFTTGDSGTPDLRMLSEMPGISTTVLSIALLPLEKSSEPRATRRRTETSCRRLRHGCLGRARLRHCAPNEKERERADRGEAAERSGTAI